MSGYLITTLLRQEYERQGYIDLKRWYLRRALRTFPLFYFVLGIELLAVRLGWLPESWGGLSFASVLAQVFQGSNY